MKPALLCALLLLVSAIDPQEPSHGATRQRNPGGPRQFDFWVGSWECRSQSGQLSGTNRIEKILGDRVLQENWESAGGGSGKSYNIYDAATGLWHQTWVDDSGTLLLLDGGLTEDGSMVMEGKRPGPNGGEVLHRVAWIPMDEGKVNQVWDSSSDDGATWKNQVDLIYSPAAEESGSAK